MSCLFNSLSRFVGIDSTQLRLNIVEYLKTNPKLMDDASVSDVLEWSGEKSLMDYVDEMSKTHVWGGAIEIKGFCDLYKMNVNVHVTYTNQKFIVTTPNAIKTCHISYNGGHFEPLYLEIKN